MSASAFILRPWLRVASVAAVLLAPGNASAHGDDQVVIEALTAELAKAPVADLFIRRGELFRHHQEWDKADADYAAAARLEPGLTLVDFFRARAQLEAGVPDRALALVDRYVAAEPEQAEGWFLRGEIRAVLGRGEAGAADYAEGIRRSASPRPEHYLRQARILATIPEITPARVLAVLDAGIARIGPVVSLVDPAIELELDRGNPEGALARLAAALELAPRRETWLVRQGDVLVQCGRHTEAIAAYRAALAAIAELPPRHRSTVPTEKLARDAQASLARLAPPPAVASP